ncbi:DASS family divalent anion:Na+ symporter [Volucribacter psittacicida]|uniref:DASS family divalent anion:Na+ symporter n=1 Tax=Volucribacter psittacicida TaxID=203482 RepID=A0A4V2PBL7_9PAST|nr:DASS family sodium-coupled anion symporter [Volucribacter psittacicida]TCJ97925.1 DASS family divalent anion:Na+ symporter [Volucribacter psittacicida]
MSHHQYPNQVKFIPLIIIFLLACGIWLFIQPPEGLTEPAWHTLIIFVSCIFAIVANVLPIGAIGIIGITIYALTFAGGDTTASASIKTALSEFNSSLIWLIVCAFLIARGFVKTGLGKRIALLMIRFFGKHSLGLAYGLALADLILAPAMPSNTARCGGVIYPIARSLASSYHSNPDKETRGKLGTFLITCIGNINDITSTIFMTAFTGNLLAAKLAKDAGVEMSWGGWLLIAIVPCLVALILVPLLVYFITKPEVKSTPEAPALAKQQLAEMGKINYGEWVMLFTVALLLILWVFGSSFNIDATVAALIGLSVMLLTSTLTWEEIKAEKGAWDTLIWFSALLMMASQLKKLGFTDWFGQIIGYELSHIMGGMNWVIILLILNAIYMYTHYFFASGNAQIAALYTVFLGVAITLNIPVAVAAFMFAFTSNLYSSLTQYTHARGPILYGSGYVSTATWWKTGFIVTLLNQGIFFTIGLAWWKVLGLY